MSNTLQEQIALQLEPWIEKTSVLLPDGVTLVVRISWGTDDSSQGICIPLKSNPIDILNILRPIKNDHRKAFKKIAKYIMKLADIPENRDLRNVIYAICFEDQHLLSWLNESLSEY